MADDIEIDLIDDGAASEATLWQTVRSDFAEAAGLKLLAVTAVLAWMAFQWGWGNDVLLPPIAARAFDAADDGQTWPSAIGATLAATGAGGLFWALTQAIDGIIVLSGLRLLPGITQRLSIWLRSKNLVKPVHELSRGTKFLIAYASGASVLCLIDVFATGRPGLTSRRRMLTEAVALAVAGVALVIAVVAAVSAVGTRVPATESAANTILRFARNPLTWIVIYGSVFAISAGVSRLRGDSKPSNASDDDCPPDDDDRYPVLHVEENLEAQGTRSAQEGQPRSQAERRP